MKIVDRFGSRPGASLVVFFQNGTYFLSDVEIGSFFREFVVTDVISQSVVQFTDANVRVRRDGRHLLLCKAHRHAA